jgi:hypothetical protein
VHFEIVSEITQIQQTAVGAAIREPPRLQKAYGPGRWRKLKGVASVRLRSGRIKNG